MRDMYLAEPSSFDEILATLTELENRINAGPQRRTAQHIRHRRTYE
jgi:hypothetical protein